jgi:hypothetical protein
LETFSQLASIEGATLRAPEGEHDDRAVAFVLGLQARLRLLMRAGAMSEGPCVLTPGWQDPFGSPPWW